MNENPVITLLIVEDLQIVRTGLKLALQNRPEFKVIADASDGRQGVSLAIAMRPQVVLMDVGLPGIDGIEAAYQIKAAVPETRILMLSSHQSDIDIQAALGVGANGYCYKDVSIDELSSAISSVAGGAQWIDPRLYESLSRNYVKEPDLLNTPSNVQRNAPLGRTADRVRSADHVSSAGQEIGKPGQENGQFINAFNSVEKCDSSLTEQSHELWAKNGVKSPQLGECFADKYMLEAYIGSGGMGKLYRAKHMHMGRTVAIKLIDLSSERRVIRRFLEEARAACQLKHPNIVDIHDFGVTENGQPYLVMDYLNGEPLTEAIARQGHLELPRFMNMFLQLGDAMILAHESGVIHCDLKPSNIMIGRSRQGTETPTIIDFGLARVLPRHITKQTQLTDSFEVYGSPMYMSPEQCSGLRLDERTDIYSLGCVMYESISGLPVFRGSTPFELFSKHLCEVPRSFGEVCPELAIQPLLEQAIFKALSKLPEDRYQTMKQLCDALYVVHNSPHKMPELSCPAS